MRMMKNQDMTSKYAIKVPKMQVVYNQEPAQYAYLSSRIIYMYLRCLIVRLYSLHVKLFTFPFDLFIFIYFP